MHLTIQLETHIYSVVYSFHYVTDSHRILTLAMRVSDFAWFNVTTARQRVSSRCRGDMVTVAVAVRPGTVCARSPDTEQSKGNAPTRRQRATATLPRANTFIKRYFVFVRMSGLFYKGICVSNNRFRVCTEVQFILSNCAFFAQTGSFWGGGGRLLNLFRRNFVLRI
jgi:hypothetical protein